MVKIFSSFKDASVFSRSLAIKNITQQIKRRGNTWEVSYTDGTSAEVINDHDLRKLKELEMVLQSPLRGYYLVEAAGIEPTT